MGLPAWYQGLDSPRGGAGIVLNEGTPNDAPMNSGVTKDLYVQLVGLGVQYTTNGTWITEGNRFPDGSLVICKQSNRPAPPDMWPSLIAAWRSAVCPMLNVSAMDDMQDIPKWLHLMARGEAGQVPMCPPGQVASMGHSPTPGPVAVLLAVAAVAIKAAAFDRLKASGQLADALLAIIKPSVGVYPQGYVLVREANPGVRAAEVASRANQFQ